jgi:holo-[acyl-carrier protein] synthase
MESDRFIDMDYDRLTKIFSAREIDYLRKKNMAAETIAGIFCAKEAFFKALGTGLIPSNILALEVLHDQYGAPYYRFSPKLISEHKILSTAEVKVSISNTKTTAVAMCIIVVASRLSLY